jgi:hypothetical protein
MSGANPRQAFSDYREFQFLRYRRDAKIRKIDPRLRYGPWAVLLAMVLLSLALFEPAYCMWLCPFKSVSEYVAVRNTVGLVQNGISVLLFVALVIVLPLLTKKRTHGVPFLPIWRVSIHL